MSKRIPNEVREEIRRLYNDGEGLNLDHIIRIIQPDKELILKRERDLNL
jgi:hypothetical protein